MISANEKSSLSPKIVLMSALEDSDKRTIEALSSFLGQISEIISVIKLIVEKQEKITKQTDQLLEEIGKIKVCLPNH